MARAKTVKSKSIQAESDGRSYKSKVAGLNAETRRRATRSGLPWDDEDVELLVRMIEQDERTFDMAISLSRTYYAAQIARQHVGFALRHAHVLLPVIRSAAKT